MAEQFLCGNSVGCLIKLYMKFKFGTILHVDYFLIL